MKKIYCILFVSFMTLISVQTFAQKIGIQGGLNMADAVIKFDDTKMDSKMIMGFNAGITLEIGLGNLLAVEAGIIADSKGTEVEYEDDFEGVLYTVTNKTTLLFVDVPVLVKVGPSIGPAKLFAAAGPYIGMGLIGKVKTSVESVDYSETEDISWGSDEEDDMKRLDYGAKFGVGAELANFTLGAYYSLGLANLGTVNEQKINTRTISISVGYKFGK